MSSTRHYDKVIKKKKFFNREEESLIFLSLVNTKQSIISKIIAEKDYFLKFKDIINHYITNDYLMDVFYYDPVFWEGSSEDEIIEFYNNFVNSIIFAKSSSEISNYLDMACFTDEIYGKMIDVVDGETLEDIKPMMSIIDTIKSRLIEHNIAMAIEITLKNKSNLSVSIDDSMQCAMIGLSTAIDKHNPFLNTKLSTSAYAWIYQTVQRYNDVNSELIQVPTNIVEQSRKNRKIINKFMHSNQYYPTPEQVCELAGNNSYMLCDMKYESCEVDFDHQGGRDIVDEVPWDATNQIEYNKISEKIKNILIKLNDREKYIIEMLFGWNSEKESRTNKYIMDSMKIDTNTFNKLKKSAFDVIRDNVEDDFTFDNWRDVFSEEVY